MKFELHMKNRNYHPTKQFVEEKLKSQLKDLPPHLSYVFLDKFETLSVIIEVNLFSREVEC